MLRDSESESEILLGNKQLLGIFCVVVLLLGIAFAGGYKVGQGSAKKNATATTDTSTQAAEPGTSSLNGEVGQTMSVPAAGTQGSPTPPETASAPPADTATSAPATQTAAAPEPKPKKVTKPHKEEPVEPAAEPVSRTAGFNPQPGQSFLQVAAVGRDEAEAVSDVLRKKGFRAHAVPKPGNPKIYRVLIGPTRDAGDISATRDALRRTGFREVILQRY